MPRLVVISGEAGTAKLAEAWKIASADPDLRFLHRDTTRVAFGRLISEAELTFVLGRIAAALLHCGHGVITAGQNLAPSDRAMWDSIASESGAALEWVRMEPADAAQPASGNG